MEGGPLGRLGLALDPSVPLERSRPRPGGSRSPSVPGALGSVLASAVRTGSAGFGASRAGGGSAPRPAGPWEPW